MEDVDDEPLYLGRVCGLDVAKGAVDACIRVPSDKNRKRRAQEVRRFGTTKRELLALADWLRARTAIRGRGTPPAPSGIEHGHAHAGGARSCRAPRS